MSKARTSRFNLKDFLSESNSDLDSEDIPPNSPIFSNHGMSDIESDAKNDDTLVDQQLDLHATPPRLPLKQIQPGLSSTPSHKSVMKRKKMTNSLIMIYQPQRMVVFTH